MAETIHIPEKVSISVASKIAENCRCEAARDKDAPELFVEACTSYAPGCQCRYDADEYITAALAAWVESGMAKTGLGYPFAEDRPDNWIADSNLTKDNGTDFSDTFPVLILKTTEAT